MAGFNLQDYVDVQTRITRFWTEYPDGAIRTSLASEPGDFKTCRYRAEVYKQATNERPDATGYAFEIAGSGMANKTSHEENCETSAIGRALANLGYATSGKDRPSRQEMSKAAPQAAQRPQDAPKQPTPSQTPAPANLDRERENKRVHARLDHETVAAALKLKYGLESTRDATAEQLATIADLDEGKGSRESVIGWNQWKEQRAKAKATQNELMPSPDEVPNPDRYTQI